MAELPIMPVKTDALIADTSHMSPEEFGAYMRLLCAMWRHGGQITENPEELSRIVGVTLRQWTKIAERVLRPMTAGGGILTQKRLTSTWMDVQELRAKRADAAAKRWEGKTFKRVPRAPPRAHANAPALVIQDDGFCNANQNQNTNQNTSSELGAAKGLSEEASAKIERIRRLKGGG